MPDIIIRNGNVIDGTGAPIFRADIGIKEDKIVEIGNLANEKAELEIDAFNKMVCPGFIDVNNHSDTYWQIFQNPDLQSLAYQGITTIIGGNCGSSLAPLFNPDTILSVQKWADIKQTSLDWLTMGEFLEVVGEKKLSVNFATLTGHATLRRGILRDQMRALDPGELAFAGKMLEKSLKEGSLGMSTGLIYTHARSATFEELVALAKIVKKYDGIYATHIRNEGENFKEAVEEAVKIAEETGVKLHISHLKIMGEKNWHFMDEALFLLGKAKEKGIDVTFDVYPYTNTGSVLYTLLPDWVSDGGKKMMINRLKEAETRKKVIQEMKESGIDYAKIEISISSIGKTLAKRKIIDIARLQDKSVEEAIVDLLIASDGRVIISMEVLNQENINKAIGHHDSIISTNGSGYDASHVKTGEIVHPRSFGTFAKIFEEYVLKNEILTWEEAVRKMTSLPAQKFNLGRRGQLKKGYFADVVVIDPGKIKDLATVGNPYQYSKGVDYVLVNGRVALADGKYAGARSGEVIRK